MRPAKTIDPIAQRQPGDVPVMAGRSRLKDGVASLAYVPGMTTEMVQ
jgi:hypothetical protein